MKSSSKVYQQASSQKFQAWNPPEFGSGLLVSPIDNPKDQIQEIFLKEAKPVTTQSGIRSSLHKQSELQSFETWQPGEINLMVIGDRRRNWNFIGPTRANPQSKENSQDSNLSGSTMLGSVKLGFENETAMILRQARTQAEDIIIAARTEAKNLLLQAQDEISAQKQAGYQQGKEQVISEIGDALNATHRVVEEIQIWKNELIDQAESVLVNMLKVIAQKIFGEGVELDKKVLGDNLSRVMESAQGLGNLNVFLHPEDAANLDPSWKEYQMLISGNQIRIIPSGDITRGGCMVKGHVGSVDGRVESQLTAILDTFE